MSTDQKAFPQPETSQPQREQREQRKQREEKPFAALTTTAASPAELSINNVLATTAAPSAPAVKAKPGPVSSVQRAEGTESTTVTPVTVSMSSTSTPASPEGFVRVVSSSPPAKPQPQLPPNFKPITLGIPGGLLVDPLMRHNDLPEGAKSTAANMTAGTSGSHQGKAVKKQMDSLFKPSDLFEAQKLHMSKVPKWDLLALLSLAVLVTSASSLVVVAWLRRMPRLLQRHDVWEGEWETDRLVV